nr:MAG TPA: hypothetical protein [Caudoviricetes sp.]
MQYDQRVRIGSLCNTEKIQCHFCAIFYHILERI